MAILPFISFPEISSGALLIRQIRPEDIRALVEISFYDAKPAANEQEALEMQQKIELDYQNGNSIHWGIEDTAKQELVGTCGYYRGFENSTGELGCVLKAAFRGQGYMSQALKLAIQFGIENLELQKVIAITSPQNTKAIQLLNRLGFVPSKNLGQDEIEFQYQAPEI